MKTQRLGKEMSVGRVNMRTTGKNEVNMININYVEFSNKNKGIFCKQVEIKPDASSYAPVSEPAGKEAQIHHNI